MGFFDSIKNIMSIPEEDDYDEEIEDVEEEKPAERRKPVQHEQPAAPQRREPSPRVVGGGKAKTINFSQSQMQVVLVKPDRFEDVTSIADHLNAEKDGRAEFGGCQPRCFPQNNRLFKRRCLCQQRKYP